jgi:O-antigen ligase
MAPIALSFAITSRTPRAKIFFTGLLGLAFVGLLVSGSRSSLVAAIIAVVLTTAIHRAGRSRVVFAGLVACAVVPLALSLTNASHSRSLATLARLSQNSLTSGSDATRQQFYQSSWDTVRSHPFRGIGFEALHGSHDIYLQITQSGGVLAIAGFLLFALATLWTGARLARSSIPVESQNLAAALASSMMAWLLFSAVQPALWDRFLYVPAGLILGMASAHRLHSVTRPETVALGAKAGLAI